MHDEAMSRLGAPVAAATILLAAGGLALLLRSPSGERGHHDASAPLTTMTPEKEPLARVRPQPHASSGMPEAPARADAGPPDAPPLSPAEAVDLLVQSHHGASELAGPEMRQLWEEVRRNPQPYLAPLRARVSLELLEVTQEPRAHQATLSAASYLIVLGGEGERQRVVALLRELQREQDALSARIAAAARVRPLTAMPAEERMSFWALVGRQNRLLDTEGFLLRAIAAVGDARLRDLLLPRLESSELREAYIDYLATTGRQDPVVRARLRKMLEAPASPVMEQHLRRFFDEPRE